MMITTTLREMYDFVADQIYEMAINDSTDDDISAAHTLSDILVSIASRNTVQIRQAFSEGFTFCLVPGLGGNIDKLNEIRIYSDDSTKLVMVICGDEINY